MKTCILMVALMCVTIAPSPVAADECPAVISSTYVQFVRHDIGAGVKNYAAVVTLPQAPEDKRGRKYRGRMEDPNNPPYTITCDCPAQHQDCDDVPYDHIHYSHSLPLVGTIAPVWSGNVTEAMALAFWRDQYKPADGYAEKQGGLDVSQNCYGYATGYGTFILLDLETGFSAVLGRCYNPTHLDMADAKIAVSAGLHHVIRIDAFRDCEGAHQPVQKKVKTTAEKNRESPVYTRTMGCSPPFVFTPQFGPVENFWQPPGTPVTLTPYGLYKEQ